MAKRAHISAAAALMLVLVILFSLCFLLAADDHDCIGEDCPVCCQIGICEDTLHSVGFIAAAVIFAVLGGLFTIAVPAQAKSRAYHTSLVFLKVKLSD